MDMEGISRNGFGYVINFAMDLATSSTSQWIRLRSRQLRALLVLAIYTLLPVRIKTSNIDAAQLARRNPGDPRSRTGDPQDPLM